MPLHHKKCPKMYKVKLKSIPKWNRHLFEEPKPGVSLSPSRVVNEILTKDIFSQRDLKRMTPDYTPSELILRMEVRSSTVQNNHTHAPIQNHKVKSNSQHDKNIKDISRVSQELAKIKSSLKKKNIKNKLMLKHSSVNMKKSTHKKDVIPKIDTSFIDNEISFISELENNLNSEREILSEIGELDLNNATQIFTTSNNKNIESKDVNNSDDIEDLQTALKLMTIYSNGEVVSPNTKPHQLSSLQHICETPKEDTVETLQLVSSILDNSPERFLTVLSLSNIAKEQFLARKYFSIWWQCTLNRRGMSELRKQSLNNFFERLMKEKCELKKNNHMHLENKSRAQVLARDKTSYQRRYHVQQNIIALQKLKLEEQNRIIEELKYNKIVEASKESTECIKEVLRDSYIDMDRRMKPKLKCLTNELKMHDIEEPDLVLHCLKVPQFLQRMENRAREREERHAIIRERRRQMEEEHLRLKQQAELAKAEMDKEEKARRIKELKEKRKQEKMDDIRRKQYAERMRALRVMADLHYEKNLLWRYGLRPWTKLIEMKMENKEKAVAHYNFHLKKNVFLHWLWHTEDMWMERNYLAEEQYRKKMLKMVFDAFKMNHHSLVLKHQVADDYYDLYVQQLVFRKFKENMLLLRKENEAKWQVAINFYESNIMFRSLTHWRVLPALHKLQRERDARKARWRQKVLQVVPDYQPPDDD